MTEREIFTAALNKKDSAERAAFLQDACAGDTSLRQRIESLLAENLELGSFLESPALGVDVTAGVAAVAEKPGTMIGPYKLLEQIGQGGFGLVYRAEQQQPVRRSVALKIIRPGMDSREVIVRFEAERQALAMMDHANIAKVLDAGATENGRPYFVMELVKGIPITDYCDQANLTTRDRLELFITVCQAVQHAHQKGIIHRDLKPTNVMIAIQDGEPAVKVIDFGVAKATGQRLTERTLVTHFAQLLGTPLYMSPEQAEMGPLDVDTRSDIYSLGVLLYELLTGTTPFEKERLKEAGYDELRRIIREEEPPKPSTRLSTLDAEAISTVAEQRRTDFRRLRQTVRGDLDWIVMKALDKDRTRRYETASSLARDIERHLHQEPVEACPPSAGYRIGKFARRNKVAIATAALVSTALILGLIGTTWQSVRATRAERVAQLRLQDANQQRERAEAQARVAELARQGEKAQRERADDNFRRARQAVDEYFTAISEHELLDEAGMAPLRKELLEAALAYYRGFAVQQADDPAVLGELAATHVRLAQIYFAMGSPEWAIAYAHSLDIVERLQRERVDPALWAGSLEGTFRYQHNANDLPPSGAMVEALRVGQRAAKLYAKLAEAHPHVVAFQEQLAVSCMVAAFVQSQTGQLEHAISNFRQALQIWEELARTHPSQPLYRRNIYEVFGVLPVALQHAGRGHEIAGLERHVIATLREVYGNENTELAWMLLLLGERLAQEGQWDEAEKHYREVLRICDSLLDPGLKTPRSLPALRGLKGAAYRDLGVVFLQTRRLADAEQHLREACDILQELASQNPANRYREAYAMTLTQLAMLLSKTGQVAQAEQQLREAGDIYRELSSRDPSFSRDYSRHLAKLIENLAQQGKSAQLAEAIARLSDALPKNAEEMNSLAWNAVKRPDTDLQVAVWAVDVATQAVHLQPVSHIWNTLGVAHYRAGNWTDAIRALEKANDLGRGSGFAVNAFFLAMAHWQLGAHQKARQWNAAAEAWTHRHAPRDEELRGFAAEARKLLELPEPSPQADDEPPPDDVEISSLMLEADPEATWIHGFRGSAYASRGQWADALGELTKDVRADGSGYRSWYELALVQLALGDIDGYRQSCRRMRERFAETEDADTAHFTAWSCVLAADATDDFSLPVQLAERAVEANPHQSGHVQTLGAVLYRAGQYEQAVAKLLQADALVKSPDRQARTSPAYAWFFLAMTYHQLGNAAEARNYLARAEAWTADALSHPGSGTAGSWNRLLTLRLLRDEAAQLIGVEADTVAAEDAQSQEE